MTKIDKVKNVFNDKKLFDQALTHRSWVNENPNKRETNERLEFLGDAILEFVVSKKLYSDFSDKPEGYLTALRAKLVNTKNLATVAKRLEIGKHIHLSKGEDEGGGRDNTSLLADTVEAVIGALYLDQGLEIVSDFIEQNIFIDIQKKTAEPLKDPKSQLQEEVQAKSLPTPKYVVLNESGPDHAKKFVIEVRVNGRALAKGTGKNKSEAAQDAAQNALKKLSKQRN